MIQYDLNGHWEMKRSDWLDWVDAIVPGSVYSDLLRNELMEDPFYRDNEYQALELSNFDYEYKKDFIISKEFLEQDKIVLHCEGLDTLADIYLNDNHVAYVDNMHVIYEFDVKKILRIGSNSISILFHSPVEFVKRKHKELPLISASDAVEGISHLRKAHCMFGWDWGPKLPDMGIWRNISLKAYNYGRINDLLIRQVHEKDKVRLDMEISVDEWCDLPYILMAYINGPDGRVTEIKCSVPTSLNCRQSKRKSQLLQVEISNPQLWWPNNFGKQPLYGVKVELAYGNEVQDTKELRIGLRTMEVRREKDEWGESFEFVVNGTAIFAMGADYIPEDNILFRCSRERTEKLIKSCVDANFNAIRVWGGAYYPEDWFYDLCDEYGLIVWQDLMYACGVYNLDESFKENITRETYDNMRRLRHHASLGLWCGNNEQEWGWVEWGWTESCSPKLKTDYIKQYEILFPEIASKAAPENFYWPASPSSGGSFYNPNDQNYGDMHYWGVWHSKEPYTAYRKHFPRFMSEFGLQSFPSLKTVKPFTLPEDRNIFSYVMESHQKNGTGNEKILYYIGENYKYPKDFDSLLFASQLVQAEGLRYGVEHWRRNRGRCMGAIYWQLNDCWPVASWSSIDYYGRYKALHYAAKRFFAPIMASACEEGTSVSLHVSNETMGVISGTLKWELMNASSEVVKKAEKPVIINALSSTEVVKLDFDGELDSMEMKRNHYLEFRFFSDAGVESSGTVLFVKSKHFNFKDPSISLDIQECQQSFIVRVHSCAFAKFVELDLKDNDAIFSDNYFDLSAGEDRVIEVKKENLSKVLSYEEFKQQLMVRSLYDTYECI